MVKRIELWRVELFTEVASVVILLPPRLIIA